MRSFKKFSKHENAIHNKITCPVAQPMVAPQMGQLAQFPVISLA
jgi:hypothetical protein